MIFLSIFSFKANTLHPCLERLLLLPTAQRAKLSRVACSESQTQCGILGRFQNRNHCLGAERAGQACPNLRLQASPKLSGLGQAWEGGAAEGGAPGLAEQRGLRRKRRRRVLILRLLSGDHPSAPPRTLGPDCPPPARVLQIALAWGEGALRHRLRGEGRVGHAGGWHGRGRELGVPGWSRGRSRTEAVLGSLRIFQSPVLPSKIDEGGARWGRRGGGGGGGCDG